MAYVLSGVTLLQTPRIPLYLAAVRHKDRSFASATAAGSPALVRELENCCLQNKY